MGWPARMIGDAMSEHLTVGRKYTRAVITFDLGPWDEEAGIGGSDVGMGMGRGIRIVNVQDRVGVGSGMGMEDRNPKDCESRTKPL